MYFSLPNYVMSFWQQLMVVIVMSFVLMASPVCGEEHIEIAVADAGQPLSIQAQLKILEKNLDYSGYSLQHSLAVEKQKGWLNKLPITTDNIEQKMAELASGMTIELIQKQIDSAENTSQLLRAKITETQKRIDQLTDVSQTLDKAKAAYNSLEQLLSNPINQANIEPLSPNSITNFSDIINKQSQELMLQNQSLVALLGDFKQTSGVLNRWKAALSAKLITQQDARQIQLGSNQLGSQQEQLQDELIQLQAQLANSKNNLDLHTIEKLQQATYEKSHLLWLNKLDKQLLVIIARRSLNNDISRLNNLTIFNLEQQQKHAASIQKELQGIEESLEHRYQYFLDYEKIAGSQSVLAKAFSQRKKALAYQQLLLRDDMQTISKVLTQKKQKALFSIDTRYLECFTTKPLKGVIHAITQMGYQIKISIQILVKQISKKPLLIVFALSIAAFVISSVKFITALLKRLLRKKREKQTAGLLFAVHSLLYALRNYTYLFFLAIFVMALTKLSQISYPSNYIILTLIYVVLISAVWIVLTELDVTLNKLSIRKKHISNLVTVALGLCVGIYAIAFMSAVEPLILVIYEKLLMISMIAFFWVERRKFLLYFLDDNNAEINKTYQFYIALLTLLPWLIILTCVVGLVGYSRLAWLVLSYMGFLMLYFIILILGLKLIDFLRKRAKLNVLRVFKYGAFVASDIVSPISSVSKILYFWFLTHILFSYMGWTKNTYLIHKLLDIAQYPLIKTNETQLSLQLIGLSFICLYFIVKVSRWLKNFSYHWLYGRIQDLGIRGSLSIFSQYVGAVIGVFVALRVLGIDLTSLAVFVGALGVGVGIGLQDIAKNFISGILLLIERPLRNGDWIHIDGYEGTVKSIGMRAIVMETFDQQEVIIPNGNAISNSLVNNTHSNAILRTVLYVGAGYDSDPTKVIAVLMNILQTLEEILEDPESSIVLWEYGDSAINYRIQYYVNIDQQSLFDVRTKVLNTIWHEFKNHQISIPFPQRDVYVKNTHQLIERSDYLAINADNKIQGDKNENEDEDK